MNDQMTPPHRQENLLHLEKSPYLLQHKDNPIWWRSWNEESLQEAKNHNKLIFLSVGYSTCHWCHVMERESFETKEVAEILNRHFVAIKLDREERPDLDSQYMKSLQLLGGQGGWPLNLILTPQQQAFTGGTYFPKDHFIKFLDNIQNMWLQERPKIMQVADSLDQHLQRQLLQKGTAPQQAMEDNVLEQALVGLQREMRESFDPHYGGFHRAPKFPPTMRLNFLMQRLGTHIANHPDEPLVHTTLLGMFKGGLYDHLAGGFARYSTDEMWLVPHFEKMLYDNSNLAQTYLQAYALTQRPLYAEIARETLHYIRKEMTHPRGGFYSAEDADSEGEEGKFYVWSYEEIKKILSADEFKKIKEIYGLTIPGNFEEHTNILNLLSYDHPDLMPVFSKEISAIRRKLLSVRSMRVPPFKDDKILTSWNALMIKAQAQAAKILGDTTCLHAAQSAAHFLKDHMRVKGSFGGEIYRRFRDGEAGLPAHLDDYAYLISGLLELFEADFNLTWWQWACELQNFIDENFWSDDHSAYFYSRPSTDRLYQSLILEDGAEPSPNAISLINLLKFSSYTYADHYRLKAKKLAETYLPLLQKYPSSFASAAQGLDLYQRALREVVLVGSGQNPRVKDVLEKIQRIFRPDTVFAFINSDFPPNTQAPKLMHGKTHFPSGGDYTIYLCQDKTCLPPFHTFADFLDVYH